LAEQFRGKRRSISLPGTDHAADAGKQIENGIVRGLLRKWRAIPNKTANSYVIEIAI
jgi:hypothetical protein